MVGEIETGKYDHFEIFGQIKNFQAKRHCRAGLFNLRFLRVIFDSFNDNF